MLSSMSLSINIIKFGCSVDFNIYTETSQNKFSFVLKVFMLRIEEMKLKKSARFAGTFSSRA